MIEYFDKEEFMKAPVELQSVTQTIDVLGPRNNVIMPMVQERSVVLHIGDRDYDIRDLVYRLLRAEGEVMALMDKVTDLQSRISQLDDKIGAQATKVSYDTKVLDDYLKGVWTEKINW